MSHQKLSGRKFLLFLSLFLVLVLLYFVWTSFFSRMSSPDMEKTWPVPGRVIVITIDTLRADHLSCYGYPRDTSPSLDAFARSEAVRFKEAYACSSWTLPSMMSFFTSLTPPQHGVEDRGTRLNPIVPTLATAFKVQGWNTSAFITHIYVSHIYGFEKGFDEFLELSIDWNYREGQQLRADQLNEAVFPWLESHGKQKYFLYLHYFDPHFPYDPPSPYDEKFSDPGYDGEADGSIGYLLSYLDRTRLMSNEDLQQVVGLYDGEIAYADHHIGRLFSRLKELDLWQDSLIVVMADHGEEFQDHGSVHHIRTLYQEVVHVPLLIKLPGRPSSSLRKVVPERISLLDLGPTILRLSNLSAPPSFSGRPFDSLMREPGKDRTIYARTRRHASDKAAIIRQRFKLIHPFGTNHDPEELYDLREDPGEQRSLLQDKTEVADQLRKEIEDYMNPDGSFRAGERDQVVLSEEQKKHLSSLGYLD
ncbi:MAG TPA: sulfatase [Thermoanaerobaculia bacterium]|nr:sulfatase [Thermoanaerobaculia bacterium]HXK66955.1 sulfatase [Thermoanaerobaculia bacterium]